MLNVLERFSPSAGATASFYSLPALEKLGVAKVSRLPVSMRVVLESVVRNVDGKRIRDEDVEALARWSANGSFEGHQWGYYGWDFSLVNKYGKQGLRCVYP